MINSIKKKLLNLKLNVKIRILFISIILSYFAVFLVLFTNMNKNNNKYNQMAQSATTASGFSIDFKRDFDYKMYRIIIGSLYFYEAEPYKDIEKALSISKELQASATTKQNRRIAFGIEKYLINLEKHVKKIENNLSETGHYDENINIIDKDIRTVTALIRESLLDYIFYENLEMENIRADIEAQTVKTMELGVVLLAVMLGGTLFFSVVISNSISKPIRQLSELTDQVAKGDLSVRSDIENGAEFKVLSDSLNIMIEKLSNLIETVKMEQSNLREAELNLLQEQINPHFLYNTLDTIMWLAEGGNQEQVVEMVDSLSHYFRVSLSKGHSKITLKEEEEHIRSYLEIQQVRYKDILEYEIHLPKEQELFRIPKITLQPLIENALYHGIKNKRGKGKITITGWLEDNQICITVADNGLGMTQERLDEIRECLEKREEKDFYGLYNVNERIRLYYGSQYGIEVKSIYQEGTQVSIRIPAIAAL